MSWEPDTPIGFSPCGTAFGAIRRAYVAKAKFFADDGPAATNRIKWYVVPDDTPVYEDWTCFWPRVDVPPDQALPQFENEGHGRDVRKFYAGNDIYGYLKDHVHGDPEDFLGESTRDKYFVEGEPDPVQPCVGTGVFAKFRFSHSFGLVASRQRFRFRGLVEDPAARRNCYTLCLHSAESQYGVGPNMPIFDGASAWTLMFRYQRRVPSALIEVDQWTGALSDVIGIQLYPDGNAYVLASPAGGFVYASVMITGDTAIHHVAAVFDGTGVANADRLKFYFDGVLLPLFFPTPVPSTTSTSGAPLQIGKRVYDGQYSNGDLDDLAGFSFAMSASRIYQIAQRSKHPAQFSPSFLYEFEEGEGTVAHDTSGNGYDATLYNGAGFCGSVCLPRSAARFRFRGVVIDGVDGLAAKFRFHAEVIGVDSSAPMEAKFRFHAEVTSGATPGEPIPAKFRFHAKVRSVASPGEPISARFRFKAEFPIPAAPRSHSSIKFDPFYEQYAKSYNLGEFVNGTLSLSFWAKRSGPGNGGIVRIWGPDDTWFMLRCLSVDDECGVEMQISYADEDGLHVATSSGGPGVDRAWHHFAMTFNGAGPEIKMYFDGVEQTDVIVTGEVPSAWDHLDGIVSIGADDAPHYTEGYMDDVLITLGLLAPEVILGMAQGEIDPVDQLPIMLYQWELDVPPFAWDTAWADLDHGELINEPDHSENVPPPLHD